jgi:hypothetical protein
VGEIVDTEVGRELVQELSAPLKQHQLRLHSRAVETREELGHDSL